MTAGLTHPVSANGSFSRPSTAESTEMLGVMMPSPSSRPAPRTVSSDNQSFSRLRASRRLRGMSESSEKIPPSP